MPRSVPRGADLGGHLNPTQRGSLPVADLCHIV